MKPKRSKHEAYCHVCVQSSHEYKINVVGTNGMATFVSPPILRHRAGHYLRLATMSSALFLRPPNGEI